MPPNVSAIRNLTVVTFDLNNNSETKYLIHLPWQLKARIPPPMTDLGPTLKRTHFYLQKWNKLTITRIKHIQTAHSWKKDAFYQQWTLWQYKSFCDEWKHMLRSGKVTTSILTEKPNFRIWNGVCWLWNKGCVSEQTNKQTNKQTDSKVEIL